MIDFLKFDDNISDEVLAAYIEGNATAEEINLIQSSIHSNDLISEVIEVTSDSLNYLSENDTDLSNWVEDYFGDESGDIFNEDTNNSILTFMSDMETTKPSNDNVNMEETLGAKAASELWGQEGNGSDPNPDLLIYQGPEGVCAIRSQQIILRDYGIDIPLEQLKEFAIQQNWYDPSDDGGTPLGCIGNLLMACGVEARQQSGCSVYDLVNELAQGHRVIVAVDANELWADREGDVFAQAREYLKDLFQETPNHALIVAGVEVNPNDPADVKVILTDPGTGDLRIEYSLDDFMDAWKDSDCFMTTTTTPAPYQYDEVHGRMIPSNFAIEHFVDTNSLPILPDIQVEGYVAAEYPDLSESELNANAYYKDGHLTSVGHFEGKSVDYETYVEAHKVASEKHLSAINHGALGQDHFDKDAFISALKGIFSRHSENPEVVNPPSDSTEDVPDIEIPNTTDNSLEATDNSTEDGNEGEESGDDPASIFG